MPTFIKRAPSTAESSDHIIKTNATGSTAGTETIVSVSTIGEAVTVFVAMTLSSKKGGFGGCS